MYVSLSRIRHIKNMFLIGDYSRAAIKFNVLAEKEYTRESEIETLSATKTKEGTLTVTLPNTQSFRKHLDDNLMDLLSDDIIGFTEIHRKYKRHKDKCNGTRMHNHLVRKRTLNHLAKPV